MDIIPPRFKSEVASGEISIPSGAIESTVKPFIIAIVAFEGVKPCITTPRIPAIRLAITSVGTTGFLVKAAINIKTSGIIKRIFQL